MGRELRSFGKQILSALWTTTRGLLPEEQADCNASLHIRSRDPTAGRQTS
jgi:hypothetical protein